MYMYSCMCIRKSRFILGLQVCMARVIDNDSVHQNTHTREHVREHRERERERERERQTETETLTVSYSFPLQHFVPARL